MTARARKVLVVDDERQILSAVQDLLEDDYEVFVQDNAVDALSALEAIGDIAAIMTDQRMPKLDGDEFLQRAREVSDATKILFTGYTDLEAVIRAVNDGKIYGYLAKPWDPLQLKTMVSNAVAHYELMQTLKRERTLLHALMDNMPDSIAFKDQDLHFTILNHICAQILGIESPETAIGQTVEGFLDKEIGHEVHREERQILSTGHPIVEKSEKVKRADGIQFWAATTKVPIKQENGLISGLISITRDVTVQKLAEEKFRRLVESAPDAMVLVNEDGKITLVNSQTERLFGYRREELLGNPIERLIAERFHSEYAQHRLRYLADPKFRPMAFDKDLYGLRKEGEEFPLEISVGPVETEEGILIASAIRDITDRMQAEQERERLLSIVKEKNRELEQIVYVTSHDLRSPLVNIQGFSKELMAACYDLNALFSNGRLPADVERIVTPILNDEIPESLEIIQTSTAKMDSLLNGLLKLSRLGRAALTIRRIEMNKLISDIVQTFEFQLQQTGADIECENLPTCFGDEIQINQLFSNLIGNALKYRHPERPTRIKISGTKKPDTSLYSVEDNGIGIAHYHQESIFQIFHRLHPQDTKGEGLGLTIIHKILERHNGRIWLESSAGKGCKFFVSLPRKKNEPVTIVAE